MVLVLPRETPSLSPLPCLNIMTPQKSQKLASRRPKPPATAHPALWVGLSVRFSSSPPAPPSGPTLLSLNLRSKSALTSSKPPAATTALTRPGPPSATWLISSLLSCSSSSSSLRSLVLASTTTASRKLCQISSSPLSLSISPSLFVRVPSTFPISPAPAFTTFSIISTAASPFQTLASAAGLPTLPASLTLSLSPLALALLALS